MYSWNIFITEKKLSKFGNLFQTNKMNDWENVIVANFAYNKSKGNLQGFKNSFALLLNLKEYVLSVILTFSHFYLVFISK